MTIDIISIRDCINIEPASNEKFVFVISPFEEDRTEIYESIIKPAVEKKGLDCKRADDFKTNTNKLNNIIRNIWKSEFIIADLTGLNPNVMYELGFAHAMNKEVIMIFENNDKENKELEFPFDIRYIEIKIYKNNIPEVVKLQNDLEDTIDFVISNLTNTVMSNIKNIFNEKTDEEFKQSIISNFEIRKKRISYFTDHVIRNLIHFRNQHYKLEKLLDECVNNTNEKNIRIFTTMAETMEDFNIDYNFPFTQQLLNNSANFIANPWIVYKFLDYFPSFQLGLNELKNLSLYSFDDFNRIFTTRETIDRNIKYLDFCIEALNEERKLVYLEVIDKE